MELVIALKKSLNMMAFGHFGEVTVHRLHVISHYRLLIYHLKINLKGLGSLTQKMAVENMC